MIVLERFCYGPVGVGTFGQLSVDAKYRCYTVEREWLNNQPFVSCLPLGEYQLEPVVSPRWGDTFALTQAAGGVTVGAQAHSVRYGCVLHAANRAAELQGCIAPGETLSVLRGEWCVTHSAHTLRKVLAAIRASGADTLQITVRR